MKLKGKKLADATSAAIKAREAEDLARAQREVARKVETILDQIKDHERAITASAAQIEDRRKRQAELQKRLDALKAGDETALDEPKDAPKRLLVDFETYHPLDFHHQLRRYRNF